MSAVAAAELGYRVHIFTPEQGSPASEVAHATTVAEYTDKAALESFAAGVDVITFEFENIPAESVRLLSTLKPVRPGWKALEICQDRIKEKSFAASLGIATAPWAGVTSAAELETALEKIPLPVILKTNRLGYDGKGQVRIRPGDNIAGAWAELGSNDAIVEGFVDFTIEVSVITARGTDGKMQSFDVVENRHADGILDVTIAPADIDESTRNLARETAEKMAAAMEITGLLAVEMFVTSDGGILVNEMAPRPHNSGHWTQDGCKTSQFEQFMRAVLELPLGTPERHSNASMKNLIGNDVLAWQRLLADPENKLHLYGKKESRPGRKMGHVNRLSPLGEKPQIPE